MTQSTKLFQEAFSVESLYIYSPSHPLTLPGHCSLLDFTILTCTNQEVPHYIIISQIVHFILQSSNIYLSTLTLAIYALPST
jgi:hypothetical protein